MVEAKNFSRKIDFHAHAILPSYIEGLKKLYFDLAGDPMPEQMDFLLKISDENHLIYGSNYPYVPANVWLKKKSLLDAELAKRNLTEKIYSNNAKKILEEEFL